MKILQQYSIKEIIMFLILISCSTKGLVSFIEWAIQRFRKIVYHMDQPNTMKETIRFNSTEIQHMKKDLLLLDKKINMLVHSDRDAIKAYITKEHHYFVYQRGWIDDYSLDCIEKRYTHYKEYEGNSFIKELMEDLRSLPNLPKQKQQNN